MSCVVARQAGPRVGGRCLPPESGERVPVTGRFHQLTSGTTNDQLRTRHLLARLGWGMATVALLAAAAAVPVATLSPSRAAATGMMRSQIVGGTLALYGVACPTDTFCEAAGEKSLGPTSSDLVGVVTSIMNGVSGPSQTTTTAASAFAAVACQSATTCEAVGEQGAVTPIVNGVLGTTQLVATSSTYPSLNGVACPSTTTCIAVGEQDPAGEGLVVPIIDGVPGVAEVVPGTGVLNGVACSDAATCVAVGVNRSSQGVVVPLVDGVPGTVSVVAGASEVYLSGVACASPHTCDAVGNVAAFGVHGVTDQGEVVPVVDGVPGAAEAVPGAFELLGVACANSTTCEAVGASADLSAGVVVPVVDGTPGPARSVVANAALWGVACPVVTTCQAVGRNSTQGVTATIATGVGVPTATFISPIDGQTNVDPTGTITWRTPPQAQGYILVVGTSRFGTNVVHTAVLPPTQSSYTPPTLPAGATLYATLLTEANGAFTSFEAITFTTGAAIGTLTNPVNGQPNVTAPTTFTWATASGAQNYDLVVGTAVFGTDLVNSGLLPPTQSSFVVPALPAGKTLHATLLTKVNGSWVYQAITFST